MPKFAGCSEISLAPIRVSRLRRCKWIQERRSNILLSIRAKAKGVSNEIPGEEFYPKTRIAVCIVFVLFSGLKKSTIHDGCMCGAVQCAQYSIAQRTE